MLPSHRLATGRKRILARDAQSRTTPVNGICFISPNTCCGAAAAADDDSERHGFDSKPVLVAGIRLGRQSNSLANAWSARHHYPIRAQ